MKIAFHPKLLDCLPTYNRAQFGKDLAADLGEKRDLSAGKPEVLRQVKARWAAWRKQMDECEPRGPFRDY